MPPYNRCQGVQPPVCTLHGSTFLRFVSCHATTKLQTIYQRLGTKIYQRLGTQHVAKFMPRIAATISTHASDELQKTSMDRSIDAQVTCPTLQSAVVWLIVPFIAHELDALPTLLSFT